MNRRSFLQSTAMAAGSFYISHGLFARDTSPVYGHNNMRYRLDTHWGDLDPAKNPVKDCHEMIQDNKGRIFLLTNETKNNVIIYNKSGKLLGSWGHEFPGAHGLTFSPQGTLFITDTERHQVFETSPGGKVLMTIDYPQSSGVYAKKEAFVPTETVVDENGDIYVADGYGSQYILHYNPAGKLLGFFGGRGTEDKHLDNAHGITIDRRGGQKPTLLVTDRTRNCFKRYTMEGEYVEKIVLPGACVCRPVIHGNNLYAAVLRSPDLNADGSGFVTILNKENKVISNLGGSAPVYDNGVLQPMSQAEKILRNPHDVMVDRDEDIYVAQWASGKVYPYKFKRV